MDVYSTIGAVSTMSLVGLCYKMVSDKNNKYRTKETCILLHKENEIKVDTARLLLEEKMISQKADIIQIKTDIVEIKSDVKEILKNGQK